MIEKLLERPEPIDEKYINTDMFVSKGTICQELREIYNMVDNEEAKIKLRVAMAMAKKIIKRLYMYRNGEVKWECQKCGTCCTRLHFMVSSKTVDSGTRDLMEAHGLTVEKPIVMRLPHRCQHLTDDNLCSIYDGRPDYCKYFTCEKEGREIESG